MANDPAFLFYPNDFLGGTMGMTFEQKGAYVELLMVQFNRGHMSYDMILHILFGSSDLWNAIKSKFEIDPDGLFFNKRLESEQNKRKLYSESRKNNKNGTNQYTNKVGHTTSHTTSHIIGRMEDEDRNRNKNKIVFDFSFLEPEYSECFYEWLEYKKQRNETYKTQKSLELCYAKLLKFSKSNPETAKQIIEDSMSSNYAGFFELKNNTNNGTKKSNGLTTDSEQREFLEAVASGIARANNGD